MKRLILATQATILGLFLSACPTESLTGPETLSSDAGLSGLTVNGVAATQNGGSFGAIIAYETSEITISFVPATGATAVLGDEPGTSFGVTRLSTGANTFIIVVTAQDGISTASYTLVVTKDPENLPATIALVAPAADETNVGPQPTLTWIRSVGARYWKVFFAEGPYAPSLAPAPSAAPASGFLQSPSWTPPSTLNPSMGYGWKVVPYDANREALLSSANRVFQTGFLPEAPTGLVVTPVADKPHLLIEWTGSTGSKEYKIFRNDNPTPIFISPGAETFSWIDGAPNAGVNTYTVRGWNDFGDSPESDQTSGTPIDGGPAIIIIK